MKISKFEAICFSIFLSFALFMMCNAWVIVEFIIYLFKGIPFNWLSFVSSWAMLISLALLSVQYKKWTEINRPEIRHYPGHDKTESLDQIHD